MTLCLNLFAGPGTGKSTTAASVFAKLKVQGVNAEIVPEYAKELTWSERYGCLACAPHVVGEQIYRMHRLMDKVDVIITDTSIIYQDIYKGDLWSPKLSDYLHEVFAGWNNLNILLQRDTKYRPYNPSGRNQSEQEALGIDRHISDMLLLRRYPFEKVAIRHGDGAAAEITNLVMDRL